jgi:signal transduction histidine kinase
MVKSRFEGKMILREPTIFIVSADSFVTQQCLTELAVSGRHRLATAHSLEQALIGFKSTPPTVIFLDESAFQAARNAETLESAVALLTETAPVVVAAAPKRQADLAFLITSGAVDFVARTTHFLGVVAGLLDRRVRLAERASGMIQFPEHELAGDFGEVLRHELNNPLTGILGNTELLLAHRDRLPSEAIERLRTIAELAVRLRETVRRLSNAWEENRELARRI